MARLKAYIANPLIFSPATREWYKNTMIPVVERYAEVINAPGVADGAKLDESMSKAERSKAIFDWNVKRLDQCDFVICVIDGVQTDDGTAWEVGYAWAKGKPSMAVRFDARDGCKEKVSRFTNLMIENSCVDMVEGLEALDQALAKYVAERSAE
ncbi:MAG: nucleoside 2-deoxyribosyltransferase [Bacillota bacterium]